MGIIVDTYDELGNCIVSVEVKPTDMELLKFTRLIHGGGCSQIELHGEEVP